ncbi:helix-turn-helix domain-containing protein [Desulfosporosinus fructosivorans]
MSDLIVNKPHFIRFVRVLKEIEVNEASRSLSISRRTLFNYEMGRNPLPKNFFEKVIEVYGVTEQEVRIYCEYHAVRNK